jgi:hypothetical protein
MTLKKSLIRQKYLYKFEKKTKNKKNWKKENWKLKKKIKCLPYASNFIEPPLDTGSGNGRYEAGFT